jgi:outer membrane protein assembly factor BamB
MRVRTFAAAVLSLSFAATLPGSSADAGQRERTAGSTSIDWPHFRFDNKHTGYQPFETTLSQDNIGSAELLWEDSLGSTDSIVYFSSPAVVKGVVYVGTDDGHLFAYSADGCGGELCTTPLWESTYIPQMIDSPAVADGIVYIGSQTDDTSAAGKLNAFAADGCGQSVCAPLWQGDAGPESIIDSSPAVWKGLVFVGAKNLYAFNAGGCGKRHCKPVWTGKLGEQTESSPVVYKGVIYVGDNDGKLYAFNANGCGARVCNPLWTADYAGSSFDYGSSPSVSDGVVYIASDDRLSAFDAHGCGKPKCKPLWQGAPKFGEGDGYIFGGSPAIAHGRVYIPSSEDTYGVAVYPAKGCGKPTCVWSWFLTGPGTQSVIESSPTIANGVVYAGRNTGEVLAWAENCKQETCSPLWVGLTAARQIVNASPTVVNGKVYIGSSDSSEDGILYVYGLPH